MSYESIRIFPLGDTALTVEFSTGISQEINRKAIALGEHFQQNPFPGFIEAVPAYSSTTLFYDVVGVKRSYPQFPTAFAAVNHLAVAAINSRETPPDQPSRTVDVPISFDKASALDLDLIAGGSGLSPEDVIAVFTAVTYRVYMLGFLPGFTYMGEVDDLIATPRKESPRLIVPKGSVGIAGRQTGIYSLESPGGWQIIGRTSLNLFTPNKDVPCLLLPGDAVRFVPAV